MVLGVWDPHLEGSCPVAAALAGGRECSVRQRIRPASAPLHGPKDSACLLSSRA